MDIVSDLIERPFLGRTATPELKSGTKILLKSLLFPILIAFTRLVFLVPRGFSTSSPHRTLNRNRTGIFAADSCLPAPNYPSHEFLLISENFEKSAIFLLIWAEKIAKLAVLVSVLHFVERPFLGKTAARELEFGTQVLLKSVLFLIMLSFDSRFQ